jgi:hypothetical protein
LNSRSLHSYHLNDFDGTVVEILSDEKPSDTQRRRRTRICILCQWSQMSSYSKFWAPSSEITGFLKGCQRIRLQETGWLPIGGLTLGFGPQDCLGRSSREKPVSESLLTEEDKER